MEVFDAAYLGIPTVCVESSIWANRVAASFLVAEGMAIQVDVDQTLIAGAALKLMKEKMYLGGITLKDVSVINVSIKQLSLHGPPPF